MTACTQRELAPGRATVFDPSTLKKSRLLQISGHSNDTIDWVVPTTGFGWNPTARFSSFPMVALELTNFPSLASVGG